MKIFVNGAEHPGPHTGSTLGELLDGILQSKPALGNFFSRVCLNKEEVAHDSEPIRRTPVAEIETLETEISSLSQIVNKNLTNIRAYLNKLIPGIEKAAELFRSGDEKEANQFFINIIDGMDWFSQVVESLEKAVDLIPGSQKMPEGAVKERQERLITLIQQMEEANKNKDWILLADLLEYEILPYYSDWEKMLPQFQQPGDTLPPPGEIN